MNTGSVTPNPEPELPASGPGSRSRRRVFLLGFFVLVVAALVMARDVLLPFLFALVLAYVLAPIVDGAERIRMFGRKPQRWMVVVVLYLGVIGGLASVVTFSVPRLASELSRLAREAPRIAAQARNEWIPAVERRLRETSVRYLGPFESEAEVVQGSGGDARTDAAGSRAEPTSIQVRPSPGGGYEIVLPPAGIRIAPDGDNSYRVTAAKTPPQERDDLGSALNEMLGSLMHSTQHSAVTLFNAARTVALSLTRGIFGLVMTLMVSAYILITRDRILEFFRSLYPVGRGADFDDLARRLDRGLAGVVRGQLIICLVNGVLSGIGFALLGLKYWTFLTLAATVMSIVPIFGSILSTIPAVIVALPQGIGLALLVLAWVVAIHQLEANFLNPKIMGDAARVHPVLVVFALLAGEHLAGIVGALLAVPALSIAQTLFFHLRELFLGVPRPQSAPPPPGNFRTVVSVPPHSPTGQGKPLQQG